MVQLTSHEDKNLLNYNQGKQDYILARLLVTKQYIQKGELSNAIECIEDIYHDIETDYDNELK